MYTGCTIRWVDDSSEMDVIIKANERVDENDDLIFFYGLSPDELRVACEYQDVMEGEWVVVSVNEVFNAL